MSTRYETVQQLESCADLAGAYRIRGEKLDGNDVLVVHEAARRAVERARRGDGPSILDCVTYRWTGHGVGDPAVYRTAQEVESWKQRDPIRRLRDHLIEKAWLDEAEASRIDSEAHALVADAVSFAEACQPATAEQALDHLYSGPMQEVYLKCES